MMARNEDLYQAGRDVLVEILSKQGISTSEVDRAQLRVDEDEKVRLHLGNLILYAYDFRVGGDTKERFEGAVSRTKGAGKLFPMNVEQFVAAGSIAKSANPDVNVIGWYLTRLPGA
jgi:hypothetical protein